jgi:hypothetical protein
MFETNQEVVAVCSHPQGFYKEGDVRTVRGLMPSFCNCGPVMVNTGDKPNATWNTLTCGRCNRSMRLTTVMWHDANDFAPINACEIERVVEASIPVRV